MSRISRSQTSDIWQFFTRTEETGYAMCKMCKKKLSYKTTISNLKKHIESKHPTVQLLARQQDQQQLQRNQHDDPQPGPSNAPELAQAPKRSRATTPTMITQQQNTHRNPEPIQQTTLAFPSKKLPAVTKRKYDKLLLALFTKDLLPFNIIDGKAFRELMQGICPLYQMPTRQYISSTLVPAIYEEVSLTCRNKLDDVVNVSVTTDTWTSRKAESFLACTVHFIRNFKMESLLLQCAEVTDKHTAYNLAQHLKSIMIDWNLEGKVTAAISDNAANIKSAITQHLHWNHIPCFAHTLNLVVKSSVSDNKDLSDLLNKIRIIVKHFKKSNTASNKLKDYMERHGKTVLKLIHDVPTRWNSLYYMLDRFVLLEESIKATIAVLDKPLPVLSHSEWEFIHELVVILKPLETVTKTISGDQYVTGSSVIPLTNGLCNIYSNLLLKDFCHTTKVILNDILTALQNRFENIEKDPILSVSTILDPRFKHAAFACDSAFNTAKHKILRDVACGIMNDDTLRGSQLPVVESATAEDDSFELSVWSSLDRVVASQQPEVMTPSAKAELELRQYIGERFLDRREDPLQWWKNHNSTYPNLSVMAQKYFCVVATSVPSERVFSKSGHLLNDKRCSLSSKKVNMLLFINANAE